MANITNQSFEPSNNVQTITPERTPSPLKQEVFVTELSREVSPPDNTVSIVTQKPQTPISPVHKDDPFLHWGSPESAPQAQRHPAPPTPTADDMNSLPSVPQAQFPPRKSSRATPQPSKAEHPPMPVPNHQVVDDQKAKDDHRPSVSSQENSGLPPQVAEKRPITEKQLECYARHANLTQYHSTCQTPPCMVCGTTEGNKRCTCSWCVLQICTDCRDGLRRIPGRNLQVFLDTKKKN